MKCPSIAITGESCVLAPGHDGNHCAEPSIPGTCATVWCGKEPAADLLPALQRESTRVNELNGVCAFFVGVLAEIERCETLDQAKTFARIALDTNEERHAGLWTPDPNDDPASWRSRR
jgi:hypothetical protein